MSYIHKLLKFSLAAPKIVEKFQLIYLFVANGEVVAITIKLKLFDLINLCIQFKELHAKFGY